MTRAIFTLALAVTACLVQPVSEAAIIYRSDEGWSIEGDEGSVLEKTASEQMRRGEDLEKQGKLDAALKTYEGLVKHFSLSLLAPKAQRKIGVLNEKTGHLEAAYSAYQKYLNKYPKGEDFDSVVESMYNIAKAFLDGAKRRVFGVPVAPSMAKAQEMFEGIVKSAPYSKWAPLSQYNAGQALEKQGKDAEAIAAYQQVVSKYPNDSAADSALYQIGYVRMKATRTISYDRADAQKARESFEEYVNRFPQSEKTAQAQENIKALETHQTRNTLAIAKFYDKTKQYKAAVIYYNDVIKNEPGTADSDYARQRIEALKSQVGEDALRVGTEKPENGAKAAERRKLQAKVAIASRPDYVGPPVTMPEPPTESPNRPKLRMSPDSVGPLPPAPEPQLPTQPGPIKPDTGLPLPPPE